MGKKVDAILCMAKIGLIGFGGGNALIPVIQKIAVEDRAVINSSEYEEDIVIASITPGALPVELAGGIGKRIGGWKWMLMCAVAMALPGALLTVVSSSVITNISCDVVRYVQAMAVGVISFIAMLLTEYVVRTFLRIRDSNNGMLQAVIISITVFVLTCGKSLYKILGINATPIFGLSTIHIFIIAFFCIFFTNGTWNVFNSIIAIGVSILYILCIGQHKVISNIYFCNSLRMAMLLLALIGLIKNNNIFNYVQHFEYKSVIIDIFRLTILFLITFLLAASVSIQCGKFVGLAFLSSLLSFGGGDAYLTVADGLFVNTLIISEEVFYGSIVPLVNILPGSILCKTLSAIGYYVGLTESGNVLGGYMVAICGFICSVIASCGVFSIVGDVYKSFEELQVFKLIKKWICPIISGLMGTVILSLLNQTFKFGDSLEVGNGIVIIIVVLYVMDVILHKKSHVGNGMILVMSVMASCVLCNI
jgi:chromate transporter